MLATLHALVLLPPLLSGTGERACPEPPDGMACIPGGPAWRGTDDPDARPEERPRVRTHISTFLIDRNEVTNAAYGECVRAKKCRPIKRYKGFLGPKQPVQSVSWFDARDYCEFVGKQLPTEAQWEKVAGGPEGTRYPWGNDAPSCTRAVYDVGKRARGPGIERDETLPRALWGKGCGTGVTADVGSRPAGHYGVFDMAGNSYEWVADWWTPCLDGCEGACGAACAGTDPKGPCDGADACPGHRTRVLKSGSWWWNRSNLHRTRRRPASPANDARHRFGFRCAKDVGGASTPSGAR